MRERKVSKDVFYRETYMPIVESAVTDSLEPFLPPEMISEIMAYVPFYAEDQKRATYFLRSR
eukprot:52503-Eustigmatos_ZCMA.PRE.1